MHALGTLEELPLDGLEKIQASSSIHLGMQLLLPGPRPHRLRHPPQVESAKRFNVDLSAFPNIVAMREACSKLEAFRRAASA